MPNTGNTPQKRRQQPKPRHVPERTCIACRQARPKRELIRIVRTPQGHVEMDPTGKKSGRGAYLCAKRSCWEPALRKGRLEREFELTLLPEDRAALEAYIQTLPVEAAQAPTSPPKGKKATSKAAKAGCRVELWRAHFRPSSRAVFSQVVLPAPHPPLPRLVGSRSQDALGALRNQRAARCSPRHPPSPLAAPPPPRP